MGKFAVFYCEMERMGSKISHFIRYFGLLALPILILTSTVSASIKVKGLYDVEIPVSSQDRDERQRALQQGMTDVVLRLAGSKGLKSLSAKPDTLDKASRYIEQYRYRKQSTGDAGLFLWARFNQKALLSLLRQHQIPVWSGSRPETLLWLAIEDKGGRYILGSDKNNAWSHRIRSHARRRGIPILLPLMDLEDRSNTRIGDIWGGFTKSLRTASNRYDPDDVMTGKVFRVGGRWNSRWTLVTATGEKSWSVRGKSATQAIAAGLDGLADYMAARYSTRVSGELSRYRLVINDVNTLRDYDEVRQYLRRIGLISKLQLDSVAPGHVVFTMDLRGGANALRQVLGLEQKLLVDDSGDAVTPGSIPSGLDANKVTPDTAMSPETMTYRLK